MSAAENIEEATAYVEATMAHDKFVAALSKATEDAFQALSKIPNINDVYRDAGITPPEPVGDEALRALPTDTPYKFDADGLMLSATADRELNHAGPLYGMARQWAGDGAALRTFAGSMAPHRWFEQIQEEIGIPGTRIHDGRIRVEPNPKLQPWLFRGKTSRPGEAEELYRKDPTSYRHINETSSLVCAATYDPVVLQELPGDESAPDRPSRLKQIVERADRMIQAAMGEMWRANQATYIHRGFSVSELLWGVKPDGFVGIAGAKFREQSSLERWHFDSRGSELVGAEFLASSNDSLARYILPRGQVPATARMVVTNIAATGNNVEGVPPSRPIVHVEKLRELGMTTWGIGYQRWGVPIVKVFLQLFEDMSKLYPAIGGAPGFEDIRKSVSRFDNYRARKPGAIALKPGIDADYMSPLGDMPDIVPMLEFLGRLKDTAFGNEAASLGQSTFGSYAMAHVADSKFMRSAPFYAAPLVRTYDEVMRFHILWNYDRAAELDLFPVYKLRFPGALDASKWIADVTKWWSSEPWTMPEPVRHMGSSLLGLEREAFDSGPEGAQVAINEEAERNGAEAPDLQTDGAPEGDVQKTALNGAQVTSMVEVLAQVASKQLPAESAIRILMRAFQMSREEAAGMVSPADGFEQEPQTPTQMPFGAPADPDGEEE